MRRTPDEKFLVKLYEIAKETGSPLNQVKSEVVAKEIGQTQKSVKNIVKLLTQANFIKQDDGGLVHLTQHGVNFVETEIQ